MSKPRPVAFVLDDWESSDKSVKTCRLRLRTAQDDLKEAEAEFARIDKELKKAVKRTDKVIKFYAKRVVKGHKFLQEHVPGWVKKINLDGLALESPTLCVLGQLHAASALRSAGYNIFDEPPAGASRYSDATRALDIDGKDYGFCIDAVVDHENGLDEHATFGFLNHLWTRAIRLTKGNRPVTVESLTKGLTLSS